MEVSMLPPTNEEICVACFGKTFVWPKLECVPFYPPDIKDVVSHMWSKYGSQEFDKPIAEDINMEYYPLDFEV
jgi:hypothetical protein